MLKNPADKYKPFEQIDLPNRTWPSKRISKSPRWLSTDLRDGNQALVDPMNVDQKLKYFDMLLRIGYKEIEIAFPSASQHEFDFVRKLIDEDRIPDDVWIQVLSPCREELIRRTAESVKGAKKVIFHIYNATSPCFRDVVFQNSKSETIDLAVKHTQLVRSLTKDANNATQWQLEYSPECFSDTEKEFAVEICNQVLDAWEPSVENKIIFNLPATVELATPNIYADQIEYFSTHIKQREKIHISLHPHNDRGASVAAAELAQMAGADRVEGCLFGNGERTGNVDLVTLALNLYTQGINPGIDLSDLKSVQRTVEECNKIQVHPRHPYGGDLVFTAFSGSHQDAIKKGFAVQRKRADGKWSMPYLPIDPADIGCTYEAVIRVNSQSGKGGVSWVIQEQLGLDLPRRLQIAFSRVVQAQAEKESRELRFAEIVKLFEDKYFLTNEPIFKLGDYQITHSGTERSFAGEIEFNNKKYSLKGQGNGPLSSVLDALNKEFGYALDVREYSEHAVGVGKGVKAACYVECIYDETLAGAWGVGLDEDIGTAGLKAVLSVASGLYEKQKKSPTNGH